MATHDNNSEAISITLYLPHSMQTAINVRKMICTHWGCIEDSQYTRTQSQATNCKIATLESTTNNLNFLEALPCICMHCKLHLLVYVYVTFVWIIAICLDLSSLVDVHKTLQIIREMMANYVRFTDKNPHKLWSSNDYCFNLTESHARGAIFALYILVYTYICM